MSEEFFSVHGAAEILRRDRRSVKIALRNTPADHTDNQGRERWRLPRVVAALAEYDRADGRVHAVRGGRRDPRLPAAGDTVEDAAAEVDAFFARLRGEPDVLRRRVMVEAAGVPCIGRLDAAMATANNLLPPDERALVEPFRDSTIRQAIGELLALLDWRLDPSELVAF